MTSEIWFQKSIREFHGKMSPPIKLLKSDYLKNLQFQVALGNLIIDIDYKKTASSLIFMENYFYI